MESFKSSIIKLNHMKSTNRKVPHEYGSEQLLRNLSMFILQLHIPGLHTNYCCIVWMFSISGIRRLRLLS